MDKRVAVYSGTRNVYPDMETSAKSLLYHNGADEIWFLIEDDEFPGPLPRAVRVRNISGQEYIRRDSPNWKSQFTYAACIRVAYADMFRQYDRILSLDIDTIINGDISGLWKTCLDDVYFAAATEHKRWPSADRSSYYNMGVALMNLKKLRENDFWKRLVDDVNTVRREFIDQDAMIELCAPYTMEIPILYNYNPDCLNTRWLPPEDIRIRHYAGEKSWSYREKELYMRYSRMSWDRAQAGK